MARQIIQNRITATEDIKLLTVNAHQYNEVLSSENDWIFTKES